MVLGACTLGAGLFVPNPAPVRAPVNPVHPANPVSGNNGFTTVVNGDARLAGDGTEGTLALGGDLVVTGDYRVATTTAGSFVVGDDLRPTALVVGGRIAFGRSLATGRVSVLSRGYVKIGSLADTTVMDVDDNGVPADIRLNATGRYESLPRVELDVRQPTGSVGPLSPFDFDRLFATYRDRSAALALCRNSVVLRDRGGRPFPGGQVPPDSTVRIRLTRGVTNVIRISATRLNNIAELAFDNRPTATSPLLVVVDTTAVGGDLTWIAPTFIGIGGRQARYILFDFPDATSITLPTAGAGVKGTIYAPGASLTDVNASGIAGNVIVRELIHGTPENDGGEIRDFPFSTTLNCPSPAPAPPHRR